MKKTIAIAAALIALFACGCGKVNEEVRPTAANVTADTSSVSESTSVESNEAAESAAEEKSSLAESGEENETYEKIANIEGYKGEYINDGNCVILNSKDEPEAAGDKYLKEYSGIEEGTVYLIHESNGTCLFYIRYVSPDGKTGEYHNEDNGWF
ncbi:MAG: hypothetical protein K6B74_06055 [Ruminococcus sp.]|nr:hypothetical protein [Ruminococcus sp.]